MYAFKKSGVFGDYDVVDELDVILYAESLPQLHEEIEDVSEFKKLSAQYFTPSNLKEGLTRSRENIADVQGIVFDLDIVDDLKEFQYEFYRFLISTQLETYTWLTPSGISSGKHKNGSRVFVPLAQAINPRLLNMAVDELLIYFAQSGFNLLNYGVDINASKTVGRLMGLPLQKSGTIVPWDMESTFRYEVKAELKDSGFVPLMETKAFGFDDTSNPENLESFISRYCEKHDITFNVGERDNNLTKLIGAISKAFSTVDDSDLLDAMANAGISDMLDHPEKDILRKAKRLMNR